jgi:hypothetical protein
MLRALLARPRVWLTRFIGLVGAWVRRTRSCPACRRQIPKRTFQCRYCGAWRDWGER